MIIPLLGLDQQGKSPTATSQRHLNMYAEIVRDADKAHIVLYGTPGLSSFYSHGDTPVRGSISVGDYKYDVHRGTFWQVDNAGVRTSRGSLSTTSGRVQMAYNGTQIVMVDGTSMYCYTIATNAFVTVGSGLFANPIDVTYQDQYFIACFANSGKFQISAAGDGTTWDALDFATAESNPDNLVRVIADHGEVCLGGDLSFEFWGNTGGQDFPYSNQRGSTLPYGLAAPWSLVKYNDSLAGLMKNEMGQVQVMVLRGHTPTPISTPELDYIINGYATKSDATALSYMQGGHPMYQINFPSAGKSWLYDASSSMWSPLEYGLSGARHLAEIRTDFLNKPRVSDYASGNVYTLDPDVYTDNGTSIAREVITKHYSKDNHLISISSLQIEFQPGVGLATGQGSNPQVMLQVSKDGGFTWGNERWTSVGKVGETKDRAIFRRLGIARDWVFKIRITDPVKVVITTINIDAEVRK